MALNWSKVTREYVIEACNLYDTGRRTPTRPSKNTFLLFKEKKYPAKFIRGLAFELAVGQKLNFNVDFEGGKQTADFLRDLGFNVEYKGEVLSPFSKKEPLRELSLRSNRYINCGRKFNLDPVHQKNALKELLSQNFKSVHSEVDFDWLIVPERNLMDRNLAIILDALIDYRGNTNFFTPKRQLRCDYFISSQKLIIEYDENQHFTIPRDISLSLYPPTLKFGFDLKAWRSACRTIQAKDNRPIFRDEQRAFYDSLRDILSVQYGYKIVRIKHGDYNWEFTKKTEMLQIIC